MSGGHSSSKFIPILTVVLSLAVALASFALPTAPTVENALAAHFRTAFAIVLSGFFIGAAVMFLQGLKGFKTGLRVAYIVLAIGILLISVVFLQLPIFGLYDLWETPWVDAGGAIIPYGVASMLMYMGMRKFAKLLDVRTIWRSFIAAIVAAAVFTVGLYFAAAGWIQYEAVGPYEGTEMYIALVGWVGVFATIAGWIAHKIAAAIGEHYRTAMRWLEAMLLGIGLGAFHESFSTFFVNNGYAYNDWGWYLWPFVVTGAIALVAGYSFRLLAEQPEPAAEAPARPTDVTDGDYIESILRVSRLASRSKDVDAILDDLRYVTAKTDETGLGPEGRKELLAVYRKLEDYLVTRDSLRNLTREEVRREVTPAFRAVLQ